MPCTFSLLIHLPPRSTLFPYTTLFRSCSSTGRSSSAPRPRSHHPPRQRRPRTVRRQPGPRRRRHPNPAGVGGRSEEHTSELQSLAYLVCRLLLEKKNRRHVLAHTLHFF